MSVGASMADRVRCGDVVLAWYCYMGALRRARFTVFSGQQRRSACRFQHLIVIRMKWQKNLPSLDQGRY